jgi:hypothetical protein
MFVLPLITSKIKKDPFFILKGESTMSSISINTANEKYKGETEAETLSNIAKAYGCRLIYQYANDFGDKVTPTDYKVIMAPGDDQEQVLFTSPYIHELTLIYRDGVLVNEKVK